MEKTKTAEQHHSTVLDFSKDPAARAASRVWLRMNDYEVPRRDLIDLVRNHDIYLANTVATRDGLRGLGFKVDAPCKDYPFIRIFNNDGKVCCVRWCELPEGEQATLPSRLI